jgi:hypothetical protein
MTDCITDAELAALKAMWANLSAAEALDAADECVPRLIREVEALRAALREIALFEGRPNDPLADTLRAIARAALGDQP